MEFYFTELPLKGSFDSRDQRWFPPPKCLCVGRCLCPVDYWAIILIRLEMNTFNAFQRQGRIWHLLCEVHLDKGEEHHSLWNCESNAMRTWLTHAGIKIPTAEPNNPCKNGKMLQATCQNMLKSRLRNEGTGYLFFFKVIHRFIGEARHTCKLGSHKP